MTVIKGRAACEALCAERGAMLYQLHHKHGPDGRMRAGQGFTAHIYWPYDPGDPHFSVRDPAVSSYCHADTPLAATAQALSVIDDVAARPVKPQHLELLDVLRRCTAAVDQIAGLLHGVS